MNSSRPPVRANVEMAWGSDAVAQFLRDAGYTYISITPGASFRGLHDSLVNYLGGEKPALLLCIHEEHAVALAHGFAKVTDKAMAVALHSNVGLMHATMAIFNAWCDRVPMLIIGAQGPMDAELRRPWVEWIHTARDLGSLIRGYVKWDDQPASVGAALEALARAGIITATAPTGPVYVCLDLTNQEEPVRPGLALPDLARFKPPLAAQPSDEAVVKAVELLRAARKPVIIIGRVSRDEQAWALRIALAERLGARVITDLRVGAAFPTTHELHPHAPGLFLGEDAVATIAEADVILSLDALDLGGTLQRAFGVSAPSASVISCSVDQYSHNGWSMDYLALPPVDVTLLATPDAAVPVLLKKLGDGVPMSVWERAVRGYADCAPGEQVQGAMSIQAFAEAVSEELANVECCYTSLTIGWPREFCSFEHPLDYLGHDGGGGIGAGPGMAVGAALALQDSGRIPVAVLGDGDFLMGATAVWTAVHEKLPLLIVIANNSSFFNDELHQERVARARSRPVENRSIGLRMSDPSIDLAMIARGQGAEAFGPVRSEDELRTIMKRAIAIVRNGAVCVIDAAVHPEYERSTSVSLMKSAQTG
ncbi:thiamine pyrophosphate-binding protein [Bosea sp. (in: a-proteobacteria)]|uniref:thiamine pyrophosphate-binding protein n=1 Tax=Bosea sp. (in: a-proteobacteria) TaxID=1871050 RepID=UPI00262B2303|nr:thiamine pyrophosphate-binding protein [Bosea sp. (in: a-proteobacteria)]MCO5089653.1 thiamine pyrophosphate-binding protein [Bosea sp. (in: a-proteobacteria)]